MAYAPRARAFNPDYRPGRGTVTEFRNDKRPRQKPAPQPDTGAEAFYYLKQMNSRTPMVVILNDGEKIEGCIEWYDRTCLKVNRHGAPNLLIQKHSIKYLYKADER